MATVDALPFSVPGFSRFDGGLRADVLLGRTTERERVYVNIELRDRRGSGLVTTQHDIIESMVALSITGMVFAPHSRSPHSVGQVETEVRRVSEPAAGLDLATVRLFAKVWRQWHLNDMMAGCAHVPEPVWGDIPYGVSETSGTYPGIDFERTPKCPVSGYSYGSSWLVKPLSSEALNIMARVAASAPVAPSYAR